MTDGLGSDVQMCVVIASDKNSCGGPEPLLFGGVGGNKDRTLYTYTVFPELLRRSRSRRSLTWFFRLG
jgi:hypothetical protein